MSEVVLILTTVPDDDRGEEIARSLVDERLAACVNVLPPMMSLYRWSGAIERDVERQLVIKTTAGRVPAIQARLRDLHPYELPEVLVLPVADGGDDYLKWVVSETR